MNIEALRLIELKLVKVKETEKGILIIHPRELQLALEKAGAIIPDGEYILQPEIKALKTGQVTTPIVLPEQTSTNSATYQQVAKWTLGAKKGGLLSNISLFSDTPATAQFKLSIAGAAVFTDKKIQNILDLPFDIELSENQIVLLEVKSDGSTTILADGCIQGEEYT